MTKATKLKDRLELDHRLRANGCDAGLFRDDGTREAARWALKKFRQGEHDKTIRRQDIQ